jgi:hypothetical protein
MTHRVQRCAPIPRRRRKHWLSDRLNHTVDKPSFIAAINDDWIDKSVHRHFPEIEAAFSPLRFKSSIIGPRRKTRSSASSEDGKRSAVLVISISTVEQMEELLPHYERELALLRQSLQQFAARYPKIAARLAIAGEHSEDPHVERMLQSFALLAARIDVKLEDDYPDFTEALI